MTQNPSLIYTLCAGILVIIGVLHLVVGKEDAQISPWNYIYSTIVYIVSIPGIAAFFFNVYLFMFERQSIMEMSISVQILPIVLMIVALYLIKLNVSLRDLPGFGRLSTLILTISIVLFVMWILDRSRLILGVFSYMPIQYVLLLFVGIFLVIRLLMARFAR